MSLSLALAILWVLAATLVAFLPFRAQFPPGIALLLAAPVLIGLIFYREGAIFGFLALAAFVSMFRNPLLYFVKKALGSDRQKRLKGDQE